MIVRHPRRIFAALSFQLFAATFAPATAATRPRDDLSSSASTGEATVQSRDVNAFSLPLRNANPAHRRSFVVGNSLFKENWVSRPSSVVVREGLGPTFNAPSCSACHFKDGRGLAPLDEHSAPVGLLVRLSVPGAGPHGEPIPVPGYGDQFNPESIVGVPSEGDVRVRYRDRQGKFDDGIAYVLREPELSFRKLRFGPLPANVLHSARLAPQIIGLGFLEAIPESEIVALEDPDDRDGDGISGRANRVWDFESQSIRLGRFGWKANQPTVQQQDAGAFLGDMGITSKHFADENCPAPQKSCRKAKRATGPDLSDENLAHVTRYVKLLAVPARRGLDDPAVRRGHAVFERIGCQACHVSSFMTGTDADLPELSNTLIHPYTDLLLHDMGDDLADGRPDFQASGREWRTPPLWGLGLVRAVNGELHLMHDGRARSFSEAILWHGGESQSARDKFVKLNREERLALERFLEAL